MLVYWCTPTKKKKKRINKREKGEFENGKKINPDSK